MNCARSKIHYLLLFCKCLVGNWDDKKRDKQIFFSDKFFSCQRNSLYLSDFLRNFPQTKRFCLLPAVRSSPLFDDAPKRVRFLPLDKQSVPFGYFFFVKKRLTIKIAKMVESSFYLLKINLSLKCSCESVFFSSVYLWLKVMSNTCCFQCLQFFYCIATIKLLQHSR